MIGKYPGMHTLGHILGIIENDQRKS